MLIQTAIVEDEKDIREALVALINSSTDIRCVASYPTGEDALDRLPRLKPDVVLMDLRLPEMSGIECIRRLKPALPATQFMALTVIDEVDRIFAALVAGATGYLLKKTPADRLLESIREIHAGISPMSGQIARKVIATLQSRLGDAGLETLFTAGCRKPWLSPDRQRPKGISPREFEILGLIAKGHPYKEIAHRLNLSLETVRTHIRNVYLKLHVHSRIEALLILQKGE